MILFFVSIANAADCAAPTTTAELTASLAAAETAFEKRDKPGVIAADDKAREALPCLNDAVTPGVAARYHRVDGLRSFLLQDEGGAIRSFAAARSIEPAFVLPSTLLPTAHPARVLYDMAPVTVASFAPLPEVSGTLRLDGRDLTARPTDRPVIYQLFDETGAVVTTFCLQATDPLPPLPAPKIVATAPAPAPLPPAPVAKKGPNVPLLVGAAGGLVVSGVLYGIAAGVRGEYDATEPTAANAGALEDLYGTNHGLVIGSAAAAGVSVALAATALVVRF